MADVGYCRVSSTGQSLEIQLAKLEKHGCDIIFKEKVSGATADRPQLKECRNYVRRGDNLIITKLDRLARSTNHLTTIASELNGKGVELIVLDQKIDTTSSTGKLLFNVMAAIAEFESEIRRERQLEGIERAKKNGTRFGRRAKLDNHQIQELKQERAQGVLIRELMKKYSLSKATIYRLLAQ